MGAVGRQDGNTLYRLDGDRLQSGRVSRSQKDFDAGYDLAISVDQSEPIRPAEIPKLLYGHRIRHLGEGRSLGNRVSNLELEFLPLNVHLGPRK